MSNHLAIATVSAALRQVISDAIVHVVAGAEVSHVRPGGEPVQTPTTGVNVFLYGVTPNPSWRNADLATRRADGQLVQRPQAALDLHYLISFYGDDKELETQRMMGSVVRALHAAPTLPRQVLRDVASSFTWLAGSDVSEAAEAVRFTPVLLNLEELSKLWSVLFQTPYALSAAYQASVVLIETDDAAATPLPVRSRNVYAVPFSFAEVEAVENADGRGLPVTYASTLRLRGRGLNGDVTKVRIGTGGLEADPAAVTAQQVLLPLRTVPADRLRAGVQGAQVVHMRNLGTPPVPHRGEESNVAPFVLRPTIRRDADDPASPDDAILYTATGGPDAPATLTVKVWPAVGRGQRMELLLNDAADPRAGAYRFPAPLHRPADTDTIVFPVPGIAPGTYLARVSVDGAESVLEVDGAGAFARPKVEVP
jgi:hypothetical protein